MIFWERINPLFAYSFMDLAPCMIWDPEKGWSPYQPHREEVVIPDKAHARDLASLAIRDLIGTASVQTNDIREPLFNPDSCDSLVLYYEDEEGVHFTLFGALVDTRPFQGFGVAPPPWWVSKEGLTPLQGLLERTVSFRAHVRNIYTRTHRRMREREQELRVLQTLEAGYCSTCGLANDYHVSHHVPGYDVKVQLTSIEAARSYAAVFKRHYGGALQRMTDSELTSMPLPPDLRRLYVIQEEVRSRIESPTVPKAAVDRLLSGGSHLLGE